MLDYDTTSFLVTLRAVPTLLLFDAEGHAAATYYGAPPALHADAEAALAALLQ